MSERKIKPMTSKDYFRAQKHLGPEKADELFFGGATSDESYWLVVDQLKNENAELREEMAILKYMMRKYRP